jgi:glycerol-3-phosphate acyltransferase PlsX
MGAAFMRAALGVPHPRVALLSNGQEAERGREEVVAAHTALSGEAGHGIHFVGNVEGFSLGKGNADVVVTDGFTGNIALKTMEGTASALLGAVRASAHASPRAALGGLLLKPALGDLRASVDPQAQGGAVLVGLRAVAVLPHGSFAAPGIARAIELAAEAVGNDLLSLTLGQLEAAHALRPLPPVAESPESPEPSGPASSVAGSDDQG